ncbi:PilZ domain-containing protein [Desulfobacterium sp. N47]|uniref:PilZ domain-containing protein n=1 Tax=uncultured Desulfobacterium sp. TaxID=201089 RepID=E1YGV9_9BACT|nr:hypothetical protein N47_F14980 [uncultured Desulfobacterium sp.]
MIIKRRESRSDVRTAVSYAVKYEIISSEEYYLARKKLKIAPLLSDNKSNTDSDFKYDNYDDALVKFLFKMDEKLDSILSRLSINEARSEALNSSLSNQGICNNISASGISIVTSGSASIGQIVHVNINLFKLPPVFIDTYGEIIRVTGFHENDISMYDLGIKFIDLDEQDKEKIITYVFSKQRKAIRNGKIESNQHLMEL